MIQHKMCQTSNTSSLYSNQNSTSNKFLAILSYIPQKTIKTKIQLTTLFLPMSFIKLWATHKKKRQPSTSELSTQYKRNSQLDASAVNHS